MDIDIEAKTDHDLLVMIAMKCNESADHLARINGTLGDHETRIRCLEGTPTLSRKQKAGGFAAMVTFFAAIITAVIEYFRGHPSP